MNVFDIKLSLIADSSLILCISVIGFGEASFLHLLIAKGIICLPVLQFAEMLLLQILALLAYSIEAVLSGRLRQVGDIDLILVGIIVLAFGSLISKATLRRLTLRSRRRQHNLLALVAVVVM